MEYAENMSSKGTWAQRATAAMSITLAYLCVIPQTMGVMQSARHPSNGYMQNHTHADTMSNNIPRHFRMMVATLAHLDTAFETQTAKPNIRAVKLKGHGVLQIGKTTIQYVPEPFDLHVAVIQRSLHTLAKGSIDITNSDTYNFVQKPRYISAAIAVAKQMVPILDEIAAWKNVGSFRDALEELLQTTMHAVAISLSAMEVTPNKYIAKKRAHTWNRLQASAASCTMPNVHAKSSLVP
jgi:hypothetical protein